MEDPYCYPGTRVLRNKLNIADPDELYDAERDLATLRNLELMHKLIEGTFDFTYLCKIHKYLFQDIYDWAGEVRTVDIAKSNLFCRYFFIQSEADRIFMELSSERYLQSLPVDDFPARLAYYFAEINALHPFREGNGRTQREFIRQLAFQNGYLLFYSGITKDEMISASIESFKRNYAPLEHLLASHLHPLR
ncbi:Fic family protein [Candidatus Saccharibacteria bacterium]|nr:Fic family protein [Candidatus Saccharibacteria bacterium]